MTYAYANEKFSLALEGLATSTASIQKRLESVCISHLVRLRAEDLPEGLRADFRALWEQVTRMEPRGDRGSIQETVTQMSDEEATTIAKKITGIARELQRSRKG